MLSADRFVFELGNILVHLHLNKPNNTIRTGVLKLGHSDRTGFYMFETKRQNDPYSEPTKEQQSQEQDTLLTTESILTDISVSLADLSQSTGSTIFSLLSPDEGAETEIEQPQDQDGDTEQDTTVDNDPDTQPQSLLQKAAGAFYNTCKRAGEAISETVDSVKETVKENFPTLYRWGQLAVEWTRPLWEPVANAVRSLYQTVQEKLHEYSARRNQPEPVEFLDEESQPADTVSTQAPHRSQYDADPRGLSSTKTRRPPPTEAVQKKSIFDKINEATQVLASAIREKIADELEFAREQEDEEARQTHRREAVEREIASNPELELDPVFIDHLHDTVPRSEFDDNYAVLNNRVQLRKQALEQRQEEIETVSFELDPEDETELA